MCTEHVCVCDTNPKGCGKKLTILEITDFKLDFWRAAQSRTVFTVFMGNMHTAGV